MRANVLSVLLLGPLLAAPVARGQLAPSQAATDTVSEAVQTSGHFATDSTLIDSAPGGSDDSVHPRKPWLSARDVRHLAGIGAAALIVTPFDTRITRGLRSARLQQVHVLQDGAQAFDQLGDPGTIFIVIGAYGLGRLIHSEHLADLGFHVGEALAITSAYTYVVKGLVGRQRPYVDSADADYFAFGRGFGNNLLQSFPSGHTGDAFTVAAAATEEVHHWWPQAPWFVGPVMYGGAGMVGLARIYTANHWSSDVVFSAGMGTLIGFKVISIHHGEIPSIRIGLESPTIAPVPGGVAIRWNVLTAW